MKAFLLALACGFSAGGLLFAEARSASRARALLKTLASALFILAALAAGGLETSYGLIIVVGLCMCALGDVFLLSNRKRALLAGIAAFGAGHLAYIAAFMLTGPTIGAAVVAAAAVVGGAAIIIIRWLNPHLGDFRLPAFAYAAVISVMAIAGVAAALARGDPRIAAGAVLFFVSDIAVARDRFVKAEFANRLWGLPLYYSAQLLFASSV